MATTAVTYLAALPGMLLIGMGAGLLFPAATNSVLGALSQGDAGVGSAANSTAIQVGGALGVAVIGSVLSTRYQAAMTPILAGRAGAGGDRPADPRLAGRGAGGRPGRRAARSVPG